MRQLFGTDGIRARADEFPLDPSTMFALGEALSHRLRSNGDVPLILMGMDTRESGSRIAAALSAGVAAGGGRAVYIGVVPTPAVAYLCRVSDAAAGISISASHNPYEDNGVKVFGHDGMKLSDQLEKKIEEELLSLRRENNEFPSPTLTSSNDLALKYERFLISAVGEGVLSGLKIVLDAGHGAAHKVGPEVFRLAGATIRSINDQPNGVNINQDSGAMHPEGLAREVLASGSDMGIAFDGDADRAIFVDDRGAVRNGDEILYLWALREKARNRLRENLVVATVMSNLGFEKALERNDVRLLRASVGDKYVLEMMLENGAVLGGEQSGHIIDLTCHTTGDGLHTGLVMAELLKSSGKRFSELETFEPMPQVLVNQRVTAKPPLETIPGYEAALSLCQQRLEGRGRILVRYSGTENLVRVMVEGEDDDEIRAVAESLRAALESQIG